MKRLLFLSAFISVLITAQNLHSQAPQFYSVQQKQPGFQREFEELIREKLQISLSTFSKEDLLARLESSDAKAPILIECMRSTYEELLQDPDFRRHMSRLDVELYNSPLLTFPFYLLRYDRSLQANSLDVGFITETEELTPVQDADILTLISEITGRPKASIHVYRERGAYPLAKNFYDGNYDIVGIYDTVPPALLDEFQLNLKDELKAPEPKPVTPKDRELIQKIHRIASGRLQYVVYPASGKPFETAKGSYVTGIVQQLNHDFPVILTNFPDTWPAGDQALSMALSNAYFLIVPALQRFLQNPEEWYKVQHLYLLNAYLNDPQNRWKGLAYLGYLLLMKDSAVKIRKQEYEARIEVLQRELNLTHLSAQEILKWLGVKIPELKKRDIFSSDVSRLYQDGIAKLDEGLRNSGNERRKLLEDAQIKLIAALLKGAEPKKVKGSRGLWSATDYNPYYQLGRIALHMEAMK